MKFSERKGYKVPSKVIQKEGITDELRNSLWSLLHNNFFDKENLRDFSFNLWLDFFKKPVDEIPYYDHERLTIIRSYYFKCRWFEVYDFVEFVLNYFKDTYANNYVNEILERELSGFRFVAKGFTDITDSQEIALLDAVLSDNDHPSVRAHLNRALELLSDRKNPDYRNSIKESISAVESLAQIISCKPKATLADALKVLEKSNKLHPALKEGYSKIYGYTSDEGGIRHAMLEEPNLSASDAKFFLLSCTSFINYLKSKI
ncbi:MAG: hypothetical protein EPO24_07955 [Bacteroidetes bacterium]|nr:MAG: hypothetical protein EPO24_07955 [Bacteroidota bacterium]